MVYRVAESDLLEDDGTAAGPPNFQKNVVLVDVGHSTRYVEVVGFWKRPFAGFAGERCVGWASWRERYRLHPRQPRFRRAEDEVQDRCSFFL
jgi:hypothetical protein